MRNFRFIAIFTLLVFVILYTSKCNCNCNTNDKLTTKIDTVWIKSKTDTVYQPEIVSVTNTVHVPKYIHDTLETSEVWYQDRDVDTAKILERYFQIVAYSDTQKVKYGTIIIKDTVSQNRITNRRLITNIIVPVVTKEITKEKKRTIGYIGFSGIGNTSVPIYAVGADFSLKFKNDKMYGVGVQYTKDNILYYTANVKLPIRLFGRK